jgi:hypothetical protein
MAEKKKPDVHDPQGVKDSRNREDRHRRDKRPKPLGPSSETLDEALAEGTIEPDPDTPSRTPRE